VAAETSLGDQCRRLHRAEPPFEPDPRSVGRHPLSRLPCGDPRPCRVSALLPGLSRARLRTRATPRKVRSQEWRAGDRRWVTSFGCRNATNPPGTCPLHPDLVRGRRSLLSEPRARARSAGSRSNPSSTGHALPL